MGKVHFKHPNLEGEDSVITEIVEEKVVELEDSREEGEEISPDRDQRIQEYLDVDKEEYLNRNEYDDIAEEIQPVQEVDNPAMKYADSNPIHEYTGEEENSATPEQIQNYEEMFRQRCKSESDHHFIDPNNNDKIHLIWERERLERKRIDRINRRDPTKVHEYFKDPEPLFSTSTTRGKLAEYDFLKPAKKTQHAVDNLKSSIPLL